ncbi:MAG: response regulator [Spirochaetota bacterium]
MFRCVVIEREAESRELVVRLLRQSSASAVHPFASIREARSAVLSQRTNLLIVPYSAAGDDGLDFLDEVRSADPLVHVIVTSSEPTLGQAVLSLQHGAVDFLSTPFSPVDELVEAISQSMVRWRRWGDIIRRISARSAGS